MLPPSSLLPAEYALAKPSSAAFAGPRCVIPCAKAGHSPLLLLRSLLRHPGGAVQYQDATGYTVLPMAAAGPGGGMPQVQHMGGGNEEFGVSASHRLIQATAGGGRGAVRPKPWIG